MAAEDVLEGEGNLCTIAFNLFNREKRTVIADQALTGFDLLGFGEVRHFRHLRISPIADT